MQNEVRGEKFLVGGFILGASVGGASAYGWQYALLAIIGFFLVLGAIKLVALVWGSNEQRAKLAATEAYGEQVAREQVERLTKENTYQPRAGGDQPPYEPFPEEDDNARD